MSDNQPTSLEDVLLWLAGQGRMNLVPEAKAMLERLLIQERIDELKELQMAPNVSDDAKDENYSGYIKDRIAELSSLTKGKE